MPKQEVARKASSAVQWTSVDDLPELDLDMLAGESEEGLLTRGAAYAREYVRIENASTIMLKNIATVLLALRRQMDDPTGQSRAYRDEVAAMYRRAGIPKDREGRIQANVRYHLGNLMRRYYTPRELQRLGLLLESPQERLRDARATQAAIVKAVTASSDVEASTAAVEAKAPAKKGGRKSQGVVKEERVPLQGGRSPVAATADHLRLATVAQSIVGQLSPRIIDDEMTDGQRAKLDELLAEIGKSVAELRRHTKKPRSRG